MNALGKRSGGELGAQGGYAVAQETGRALEAFGLTSLLTLANTAIKSQEAERVYLGSW